MSPVNISQHKYWSGLELPGLICDIAADCAVWCNSLLQAYSNIHGRWILVYPALPPSIINHLSSFFVSNYSCINPITRTISHVIVQSARRSGSLSGFLTNIKTNWKQYRFMSPWERAPYQRPALHPLPGPSVSVRCSLFLSSQLSPSSWFPLFISLSPY